MGVVNGGQAILKLDIFLLHFWQKKVAFVFLRRKNETSHFCPPGKFFLATSEKIIHYWPPKYSPDTHVYHSSIKAAIMG